MEITKVTDETFESIQEYLNILANSVRSFNDLSYVTTDKALYMICPLDDKDDPTYLKSFAIVKNDGKTIKDYCFSLNDKEKVYKVITGQKLYVFDDANGVTYKKDLLNGFSEHLAYKEHTNGANVLYYVQKNPAALVNCMQQYIVNEQGHTLDTYLPYLTRKKPNIVGIDVYKRFLGLIPYTGGGLYIKAKDDTYVKGIKLPWTNGYFGLGYRGSDLEEIIDENVIHPHVSDDIADLYRDRDKLIGDVEEVTKAYKKELLSKK